MADRNEQPTNTSQPDAESPTPNQPSKEEPQCQQFSAESSQNDTSQVRNSVLEAIANQQRRRISELERTLEKKRATIQRLSAAPPLPHPSIPILPPSAIPPMPAIPTSAPISSAPSSSAPINPTPTSQGASASSQPPSHAEPPSSQPQPAASTAASNPVMAAPMLGFPPQPHLPPYPYLFPPPDPAFAAQYMGVVPPTLLHPAQASQPQPSRQVNQQDKGNDGQEQKQSRYWTPDEHERFLAGMKACGPKNYLEISEYVGTRNAKQVRTHAQKYQKRLEREDAKRRSDMRHRRINNSAPATSVAADAAAAVKAAAAAAMRGKVPGTSSTAVKDSDSTGTPAGPSSSSSGKQFHSSHQHSQGASSGDGSISANTAAEQGAETSKASNHSAAVAAIAAEAKALGRGVLPPGAIKIPSQTLEKDPQPTMVNKNTGNVEHDKSEKDSKAKETDEPHGKQESLESSARTVQKCNDAARPRNKKDRSREVVQACDTRTGQAPTIGDSTAGGSRTELSETNKQNNKDQTAKEQMEDAVVAMHTKSLANSRLEKEASMKSEIEHFQNEQPHRKSEGGNDPECEKATADSVVHRRLTKTAAGRVTKQRVASRPASGVTSVKCEEEYIGSSTNLVGERNRRTGSNSVCGATNRNDGKANITLFSLDEMQVDKPATVKHEAHMVVMEERESSKCYQNGAVVAGEIRADKGSPEKAVEKSGIGEERIGRDDTLQRGHGAGDESTKEDAKNTLAATKQASTVLDTEGASEESAVASKKRARNKEATEVTKGIKKAKKGDGGGRKESTAAEAVGGSLARTRPTGGNSAVAASQQT
eukprot:TRINITY_DN82_c0_g1_i1.p1 TRINITY_DN82_c0_g1~~TRINITY_DN82_c0_g1_i1.p1  ORF type:complete len:821 (+),score=142.72 TRINITY_DN82_c0_g1_i1:3420-5882(+)